MQVDVLGRPWGVPRLITDQITTDASYQYDYSYDSENGLPSTMTYPVSSSDYRFKLQYEHAYGQIAKVRRFDSATAVYWKFNTLDARGNVHTEELGNGVKITSEFNALTGLLESRQSGVNGGAGIQDLTYQWSNNGNLTQRRDVRQNKTEVFSYDSLERLDVTTLDSSPTLDVDYNSIGNIAKKSDVGSSNWTYDGTRKHAVTAAGSNTFTYDADGNMQNRTGSAVTWFSYNLPKKIDGSGVSSEFTYDPLRNRVKQVATDSTGTETTHYIGGLMEKVCGATCTSSNTQYRHYIPTPNGIVGLYTRRASGTSEDTFYFTKDHLGSIDSITNASGVVQVRLSYDAFGKRRNDAGWSGSVPTADWTAIANTTRRGYTGHEHLDNLGLIHMNGRVQDPALGRFLSADPFVPNPLSRQSFNRYSYTVNNPLSRIDPSGFIDTQLDDPDSVPREGNPPIDLPMDLSWLEARIADARRLISPSNPFAGPAGWLWAFGTENVEAQSTVNGVAFGAENMGGKSAPYTLQEPSELTALRRAHPEINALIKQVWTDSFKGYNGEPHEVGALVYRNRLTGQLTIRTDVFVPARNPKTGRYDQLTWADPKNPHVPKIADHEVILHIHSHPFPWGNPTGFTSQIYCTFHACAARGPSVKQDMQSSRDPEYGNAYFMIVGAGYLTTSQYELWYYGRGANINE